MDRSVWRLHSGGIAVGRARARRTHAAVALVVTITLLATVGCAGSGGGRGAGSSDGSGAGSGAGPGSDGSAATASVGTGGSPGELAWLPGDALDLLAQSVRDSCAVCAEKNRTKAFALLDAALLPGTLVPSTEQTRFLTVAGEENELGLSSYARRSPGVTFRFHTGDTHLVGVAETDWTDDDVLAIWQAAPAGTRFEGLVEVVAYAYGDGPSYLWSPAHGQLQIQCRILEIAPE